MSKLSDYAKNYPYIKPSSHEVTHSEFQHFLSLLNGELDVSNVDMSSIETQLQALGYGVNHNATSIETLFSAISVLATTIEALNNHMTIDDEYLYITINGKTHKVALASAVPETGYPYVIIRTDNRKYVRSAADDADGEPYPIAWKYINPEDDTDVKYLYSQSNNVSVGYQLAHADGSESWNGTAIIKVVNSPADEQD